jgi:hypothetical protein
LFRSIVALYLAFPFWKLLAFVFLTAILGTSLCLVFFLLTNTVLLLGGAMLPTWYCIVLYCIYYEFKRSIYNGYRTRHNM